MKASGKIRRSEARRKAAVRNAEQHPGPYDAFDRKKLKRLLAVGHRWEGDGWKPTQARGAWSYRGARVNTDRGRRASEILKQTRLRVGVTRRQLDRARHEQRVSL